MTRDAADAVVVGGGTIGGWTAWFLKRAGLDRVVLLEAGRLGAGASSRAAGMVRAQGGTETAVRLGLWSRGLLRRPAGPPRRSTRASWRRATACRASPRPRSTQAQDRIAMQQRLGLDVRWLDATAFDELNPAVADGLALGSSYAPGDGYLDPPRNVLAYTTALVTSGVDVREGVAFTGLQVAAGTVTGVATSAGDLSAPLVVLTGGAQLAEVGRAGRRAHRRRGCAASGRGHRGAPRPGCRPAADGLRRAGRHLLAARGGRPDVGHEQPRGAARRRPRVRRRLPRSDAGADGRAGAGHRASSACDARWAATIDFTPDHLPILGPAIDRRRPRRGHRRRGGRRPRDDVGTGGLPGGGRPRPHRRRRTSSTSPTSGSTVSTRTAAAGSPPTRSRCRSRSGPDRDRRHHHAYLPDARDIHEPVRRGLRHLLDRLGSLASAA